MLQEPKAHRVTAGLAERLLQAADTISRRGLTLKAYMRDNPQRYALPEIAAFGKRVDEAMSRLAAALREREQPPSLPDLPESLRTLQAAVRANKQAQNEARAQWNFLLAEAKRIATNIEAIRQLLLTGSFS